MLSEGDKITLCLICLKQITPEQAEQDLARGMACKKKGHVLGVATCTYAPKDLPWFGKTLLKPGDRVVIGRVDPYGMIGRDKHPPVNNSVDGELPDSPVNGKEAFVVRYWGWADSVNRGAIEMVRGNWGDEDQPEAVFRKAKQFGLGDTTHMYEIVVPGHGVFEFADYELEGFGD